MKLKTWIPVLLVCSILTLSACSTKHRRVSDGADIQRINSAYGAYDHGARASGLGKGSRFNREEMLRTSSKNVYYFDFDSNVIHENDKPAILAHSERLANNPNQKILLEGHTDPRGSREYNIGLGERRAQAIANLMRERGVEPSQIRVVSYGAQKLASNSRDEAGYQRDRRAVITER